MMGTEMVMSGDGCLVFVYGTLLNERVLGALGVHPRRRERAMLVGYKRVRIERELYPTCVASPGDAVSGEVQEYANDDVLAHLDAYEDVESGCYIRRKVRVELDRKEGGSCEAFVYICGPSQEDVTEEAWSYGDFERHHVDEYLDGLADDAEAASRPDEIPMDIRMAAAPSSYASGSFVAASSHAPRAHLVLYFRSSSDSPELVEMTRQGVLADARAVAASGEKRDLGSISGLLQPRDLRRIMGLTSTYDAVANPGIVVRRHSIILNLFPVRALIMHDRCLLFVPRGADSFLMQITSHVRNVRETANADTPFEQIALEAALISVCSNAEKDLRGLSPSALSTVKGIMNATTGGTLERLRQEKDNALRLASRMKTLRKALQEILESDSDIAHMDLTQLHAKRRNTEELHGNNDDEMGHVEILLEHYLMRVDGFLEQIDIIRNDLLSAESSTMLRLDAARNRLLQVELMVASITAVGTIANLIAAAFGMNLKSGLENDDNWFWSIFCSLVFGSGLLVWTVFHTIKKKGWLITSASFS